MSVPIRERRTSTATVLLVAGALLAALVATSAAARSTATPSNVSSPTISGVAVEGETLTGSLGAWTGTPPISYAAAWHRCDATGAGCAAVGGQTTQTYAVTTADIGFTLRFVVTATNGEGAESAASQPTAVVTGPTVPVSTADPVVTGSAVEGSTLTTTTGTWTGTAITYAYQWVRCDAGGGLPDGSDCPSIPGATSSSYTPVVDDIGRRLRVQVIASNVAGSAAAASNPTSPVTPSTTIGPPRNAIEPSISGTMAVGRSLLGSAGTWEGSTPLTFAYRWVRCAADGGSADGSSCTTIPNATASSYTTTSDDVGHRLRIVVTATNSLGERTAASNATAVIQGSSTTAPTAQAPRNTSLPSIIGSPAVGGTLTATSGTWTGTAPLTYSYRWLRCDADGGDFDGSDCPDITGATGTQYRPTAADLGRRLRVQVTARNSLGTDFETSNATAQVQSSAGGTTPPPANLPPGAVRLGDGKYSIPVTSVSLPARLLVGSTVFVPRVVRSRARPLELRVRVLDTRGYVVRSALVLARSTPLVTTRPGEVRSGRDGWVRIRLRPRASFPLDGRRIQFVVSVRKQSDGSRVGVSSRRVVRVLTARR